MVGNDVVDLRDRDVDPSTWSARFDERVFGEGERELLARSDRPVALRWTLWAAKEAAYKLVVKRDPDAVFSPSRYRVSLCEAAESGVVAAGPHVVPVRIQREADAVHAVATTDGEGVAFGLERLAPGAGLPIGAAQLSDAARRLAILGIAEELELDPEDVEIRKLGRIPELFVRGARLSGDLSLSHHGSVVAFAFAPSRVRTRSTRPGASRQTGRGS
jgi:hypothetical protein